MRLYDSWLLKKKKEEKKKFCDIGCVLKSGGMVIKDFMLPGSGVACYRAFYFSALPLRPL